MGDATPHARARVLVGKLGAAFCKGVEAQDACSTCTAVLAICEATLRAERIAGARAAAAYLHGRAVGCSDEVEATAWQRAADDVLEECGEHGALAVP
jgi:hypothetical protein